VFGGKNMKKIVNNIKTKGVRYLSDYDLLKLITQVKDSNLETNNEISESINLSEKSFIELLNKKCLNEAQACSLIASLELGRRLYSCSLKKITKASDIYPEIQHYADRKQEHFIVVSLNEP
jgi:DNA repair protein RadC